MRTRSTRHSSSGISCARRLARFPTRSAAPWCWPPTSDERPARSPTTRGYHSEPPRRASEPRCTGCATGWRSPMSADNRCRKIRELAAEVALGIADGEDRARVLKHAAECADCRRELERLSTVADELLVLAPEEEPPPGFELRVLDSILPPAPKRRFPLRGLVLR